VAFRFCSQGENENHFSLALKSFNMKKLMLAFCLMIAATATMYAQDTTATDRTETQYQDQDYTDKDVIASSELPATIREQLQSQDYRGYTIDKAWRKTKDGETMYAVLLRSGNDKKKVKFDSQGNVLKEKDKDKDDY
jgi:hypothetical protein